MRYLLSLTLVLFVFLSSAFGQSSYTSETDKLITVRTISILPIFDNMRGIYSRPAETHLFEQLKSLHQFEISPATLAGPILTPDELEQNSEVRESIANSIATDAFVAASVIKGPSGIAIKMSLFLKADKKLLAQEVVSGLKRYDVETVKKQSLESFKKLLGKLPYSGLVMSRQGTRLTVNLGLKNGVAADQVISVVQIIKLIRHPKFDFLVNSEKEVIGKIKLLKVDETLSFARIVTEVEAGAIQVNSKLANLDSVTYANTDSLSDVKGPVDSLPTTPEGKATYGEKPIAWLPTRKPTFGMVGARLGLGQFTENVTEASGSGLDAKSSVYPHIGIEGELWLTPQWSMHAKIKQGIITTDNPVSGGSPSELSRSLSNYEFLLGYNLRLSPAVNSAKVEGLFGFAQYRLSTDTSTPAGLTTKSYSGVKFGVSGAYPLSAQSPYSIGANLNFWFNAGLSETPSTSGRDDNSVNSFGFFVDKDIAINLRTRYALDFELYSSDFSGGAASSSSQKHTSLSAGIYYLF